MKRFSFLLACTLLGFCVIACGAPEEGPPPKAPAVKGPAVTKTASTGVPAAAGAKISIKGAGGATLAKIKTKASGWSIVDGSGKTLAKIKAKGAKWKVKDGAGNAIMSLKVKGQGVKIVADGKTRFKVKPRDDGGLKISDGAGNSVVKIKPKGSGFKVADYSGKTLAKIKVDGNTVKIKVDGTTKYKIKGFSNAKAATFLAVERLKPLERYLFFLWYTKH